jgi:hypothetical protein
MRIILDLIALHTGLVYSFFHAPGHRETRCSTSKSGHCATPRSRVKRCHIERMRLTKRGGAMRIRHAEPCKATFRVACLLSAFLCTAVHAHHAPSCSGGPGGGVDATGNQCSAAGHEVDSTPQSEAVARPAVTNPAAVPHHATAIGSPSVGHVVPGPHNTAVSQSTDRFARQAKQARAESPVGTAKTANTDEGLCSGGSDGGTDATGNQCNAGVGVPLVQTGGR